jgi:hypothetical protein
MKKIVLLLIISLYAINHNAACDKVKTLFKPLSSSMHLQTQYHKPMYDPESIFNANIRINYYYQSTREKDYLAQNLFQYNPLLFQGEIQLNGDLGRDQKALVAPYFGLQQNANISLQLNPRITNTVVDIQLNLESERYWLQTNFPITRTVWKLNKYDDLTVIGSYGNLPLQDQGNAIITASNDSAVAPYNTSADGSSFLPVAASTQDLIQNLFGYCNLDSDFNDQEYNTETNPFGNAYLGLGSYEKCSFYGSTIEESPTQTNFIFSNQYNINLNNQINDIFNPSFPTNKSGLIINQPEVNGVNSITDALGGFIFGDLQERKYNLFNFSNTELQQQIGLADINTEIGYDFIKNNKGHFGSYIKIIIPTGTHIGKEYVKYTFAPIIGNGRHFELGLGISGHYMFSENQYNTSHIHIDGYLTHLFSSRQFRTFDKKNLPMSRYALVKELHYDIGANAKIDDLYSYNHTLKVLGDVNSDWLDISVGLRGEGLIDIVHHYKNWEIGAGYCFAGQTQETASYAYENSTQTKNVDHAIVYGFKGNTYVDTLIFKTYGPDEKTFNYDPSGIQGSWIQAKTNGDVATDGNSGAYKYGTSTSSGDVAIGTMSKDVFILSDIDCNNRSGLMDGQILHKLFFHIDYMWSDIQWEPQIGVFGSYGFSPINYKTADYWDIGARFGFIF